MKLRALLWAGCISLAMAASAVPALAAAAARACPAGKTVVSSTWDFKGEANTIFEDIQTYTLGAQYHAGMLDSPGYTKLAWEAQAEQLDNLRSDINKIGDKLCPLEAIRRALAPWQQRVIDGIEGTASVLADNAQHAILFANANRNDLWDPTYRHRLDNIYSESKGLTRYVDNAVELPAVTKEYQDLRRGLGE